MKAKNMFVGQRVQIKEDRDNPCGFYLHNLGRTGTITRIGYNSDVTIKFDDGDTDWGHHDGIRKVKEA